MSSRKSRRLGFMTQRHTSSIIFLCYVWVDLIILVFIPCLLPVLIPDYSSSYATLTAIVSEGVSTAQCWAET